MSESGRLSLVAAVVLALAGCPLGEEPLDVGARKPKTPLRMPRERLDRGNEEVVLALLDQMRGGDNADYLGRVKAEEELDRHMREHGPGAVPYLVQLLDDPQWDVRAATLRLLMRYGRSRPEAVGVLVDVIGDMKMNPAVRDDAARALRSWTRKDFGYRAWSDSSRVKAAAARWREWLEETGGLLP